MKKHAIILLILLLAFSIPYSAIGSCTIHLPSLVTELGGEYTSMGATALQEMFGENILSMEADEDGNVSSITIDGSAYFDFESGILNQTGHMDAAFCGEFNLSEAEGQGFVAPKSMDVNSVGGVDSIPGISGLELTDEAKEALEKLID